MNIVTRRWVGLAGILAPLGLLTRRGEAAWRHSEAGTLAWKGDPQERRGDITSHSACAYVSVYGSKLAAIQEVARQIVALPYPNGAVFATFHDGDPRPMVALKYNLNLECEVVRAWDAKHMRTLVGYDPLQQEMQVTVWSEVQWVERMRETAPDFTWEWIEVQYWRQR
jgi:hypothetical protein